MFTQLTYLPQEGNWTLAQLNDEQVKALIPAIVYTIIMSIVGTFGNGLVIYIHCTRFSKVSYRFYVLLLGFCDIIMCTVGMPFLVYDALHPYTFSYAYACKSLRFVCYFFSIFSIFTLTFIAIERHRKICKPLSSQVPIRVAKNLSLYVSTIGAFVTSIPSFFIFGLEQIPTGVQNIHGIACFTDMTMKGSVIPAAYNIALIIVIISFGGGMVYCYDRIRATVRKRANSSRNQAEKKAATDPNGDDRLTRLVDTEEAHAADDTTSKQTTDTDREVFLIEGADGSRDSALNCDGTAIERKGRNRSPRCVKKITTKTPFIRRRETKSAKRCVLNSRYNVRLSKILILISTVYGLSFIPHLTLMIIVLVDEQFLSRLNFWQSSIYYLFLRSFLINSVANPFIYGCMDKKFRHECKKLFFCNISGQLSFKSKDISVKATIVRSSQEENKSIV